MLEKYSTYLEEADRISQEPPIPTETPSSSSNGEEEGQEEKSTSSGTKNRALGLIRKLPLSGKICFNCFMA